MKSIRDLRRPFKERMTGYNKKPEGMEEVVCSALGAIDKLIEPDVKIWDNMEKVSINAL